MFPAGKVRYLYLNYNDYLPRYKQYSHLRELQELTSDMKFVQCALTTSTSHVTNIINTLLHQELLANSYMVQKWWIAALI